MSQAFKSKLDSWLSMILEAGWLAALVIAPLFFNVFSSRVFEPDKISLIRSIALVMLVAWIAKSVNSGELWAPAYRDPRLQNEDIGQEEDRPWWSKLWHTPLLVPILLLVTAYAISTFFSVARHVSWWGSYQRLQGTYSFLSYVIIALITMGHLRLPVQVRRIQHAIILTSLPIAIYGIVQHYGIDPLPWGGNTQTRVAGNAGNAIFLAAYLIMAFFFTFERVYSSFAHLVGYKTEESGDQQDLATALAGGAYLFVLMVQTLAIYWTSSRGPWLGLLLGIYLFILLLFTALRPKRHRLWTSVWVGLGAAGVVMLFAVNTMPMFDGLRDIPNFGRLTTMLESEGGTGRVRLLIWQGSEEMVRPHEPLLFPDGSLDRANAIRPLVGYGPEAMWIAYNPFYPPELAQLEARNASPDRAHNETWDSLVITGVLGFMAYLILFISIFYWALRWLGLLVNRRDSLLFASLLVLSSLIFILGFRWYDESWRFFGVALPAGMMLGLGIYVTLAAFIHPHLTIQRADLTRQLLIIALLATMAAHFTEIHFGIAIAATRTYFWVYSALLVVLGMQWAMPENFALVDLSESEDLIRADSMLRSGKKRGKQKRRGNKTAQISNGIRSLPPVATTVMTDILVFLTFVFIYTTNTRHVNQTLDILFGSITRRSVDGEFPRSPAILFLMIFTWFVAATVGQAAESLQHRKSPTFTWWLRGYALHALIVWASWFAYGLYEAAGMRPEVAGSELNQQLEQVSGHFAMFTWLLIIWLLIAAVVYAWPWLRNQRLPAANNWLASAAAGAALAIIAILIVNSVNVGLVRADIIYKQGQQFDAQGNWVSSVELYRRALNARRTEDHYMLFLGRALLEQAKRAQPNGVVMLTNDADLEDVLKLTPEQISQMGRIELLKAAELVLQEAQRVNPLNTDHTANLARLYRTWADLTGDETERAEMLDKSVETYKMAVQLSPNAAHIWNEKGNAHLGDGEPELAEESYLYSLSLDEKYDQTYLLLADFYERNSDYDKAEELLRKGIEQLPNNAQLQSFLGVAAARQGKLEDAIQANLKVVELQPGNYGAMRNLALLYRDLQEPQTAIEWAERSYQSTSPENSGEYEKAILLLAQLHHAQNNIDEAITYYEQLRTLDPSNVEALTALANLYLAKQDPAKTVDTLRRLAEVDPGNFEHPYAIAQILQQAGQPADALDFAQQAYELAPEDQKAAVQQLITSLGG